MKKHILVFALVGILAAAPSFATAQTMDPNMPGVAGTQHDVKPADAQGSCFDRSGMYSKGSMGAPEAAE